MKRCPKCQVTKPLSEFHLNASKKDGHQAQCKSCKSQTDKNDYRGNNRRKEVTARTKEQRNRLRSMVQEYLLNNPCVDCGNGDVRVLEFDHVTGVKRQPIAVIVKRGWSCDSLREEIEKCEVRCANCHRIRHFEERLASGVIGNTPHSECGDLEVRPLSGQRKVRPFAG